MSMVSCALRNAVSSRLRNSASRWTGTTPTTDPAFAREHLQQLLLVGGGDIDHHIAWSKEIWNIHDGSGRRAGNTWNIKRCGCSRLVGSAEAVANSGFGENVLRPFRVGFYLLSQLSNIHAKILCVGQIVPQLAQ